MAARTPPAKARPRANKSPANKEGDGNGKAARPVRAASPRRLGFEIELEETAARLFASRGFAGTTLRDIADEIGMSRSSLYNYVTNKEDLLRRLCEQYLQHGANQIHDLLQRTDMTPLEKLELMVTEIVRGLGERPALTALFEYHRETLPEEYRRPVSALRREINALLVATIRDGIRDGFFIVDDEVIASYVIGNIAAASSRWLRPDDDVEHIARCVATMAVRSLQRRPPDESGPLTVGRAFDQLRQDVEALRQLVDADAAS